MGRIEAKGLVKGPSGPGELLPSQPGVSQAYIELHRIRIERKALSKHFEGPVIISIVVKPVRLFVVFLGAEEPIFLHGRLLGDLSLVETGRAGKSPPGSTHSATETYYGDPRGTTLDLQAPIPTDLSPRRTPGLRAVQDFPKETPQRGHTQFFPDFDRGAGRHRAGGKRDRPPPRSPPSYRPSPPWWLWE